MDCRDFSNGTQYFCLCSSVQILDHFNNLELVIEIVVIQMLNFLSENLFQIICVDYNLIKFIITDVNNTINGYWNVVGVLQVYRTQIQI